MNNYLEFEFKTHSNDTGFQDILIAFLADIGFDSFAEEEKKLLAYLPTTSYNKEELDQCIANLPFPEEVSVTYSFKELENKNWNEEWEKNYFQPSVIGNQCIIHSTFHKDIPQKKYNIIINPQMSFGTGHHETTSLMIENILKLDFSDKMVLDMGSGTGILAILAKMKGAKQITAIDVDSWCIRNAKENISLNELTNIEVMLGNADSLDAFVQTFDVVFANINRNILLEDMPQYSATMKHNATLMISGFYEEDADLLRDKASQCGLVEVSHQIKNRWMMIQFQKA